jgi:hypothetical protein
MSQEKPKMPKEFYTLKLSTAQDRVGYWKEAIEPLYGTNPHKMPHGFYLHMKDIQELANLQDYMHEEIKGVRVYFTFDKPQTHPHHNHPHHLPDGIRGILVPVYLGTAINETTGAREPALMDLIVEVTPPEGAEADPDDPYVSVFDVTQPCPPLCDPSSDLY